MSVLILADLFVTKSAEYLLVIGFLVALVLFWRLLARRPVVESAPISSDRPFALSSSGWFGLALERLYHPGHAWAQPEGSGLVRLGIDDFAQKLVGRPDGIDLPEVGASVEQGKSLSQLAIGGKSVDLLAPIDGEVVEHNCELLERPALLNEDPYGTGWLLKVRPRRWEANSKGLLREATAKAWMNCTEDSLRRRMAPSFGLLMQDGGVPVSGIAKSLAGEDWDEVAKDFLLS